MKVKVPVNLVIAGLERRLTENREVSARNQVVRDIYDKDKKTWANKVDEIQLEVDDVSFMSWRNTLQISYKVPSGTKIPDEPCLGKLESELGSHEIEEISNAIRILGMSEDEYVSASTMKEIGRYL
jgi:hypothetical protein